MLLKAGANPNATLRTGETVLMTAARTGNVDVVEALLARGADVNAREMVQGHGALMWAAAEGHAEVARVLREHGADVHARSSAGFTALMLAGRKGDLQTTRGLLAAGADVNEATPDGATALLVGTIRGHIEYAALLLGRGANPNMGPGFTPLHWAAGEWPTELTGADNGIAVEDNEWAPLEVGYGDRPSWNSRSCSWSITRIRMLKPRRGRGTYTCATRTSVQVGRRVEAGTA